MAITSVEAWLLARGAAGYPVLPEHKRIVSHEVFQLCEFISSLSWKDRQFTLQQQLSPEDYQRVLSADAEAPAPTMPRRAWQIIRADELATLPKSRWLVPNHIPENGLAVIYGPSGAYKSFMALHYALLVSQHHPVIYTVYEGLNGYWQRIKAWTQHHRRNHGSLYVCLGNLAVMNIAELGQFIEEAKPLAPKLVVIDTLARSMTGSDENSTRDMGMFIAACDRLRVELNCTVLIIHHTGKGGITERGSSALRGAVDVMFKQYVDDETIVFEYDKVKDAERPENLYFRPVQVNVTIDDESRDVPVLLPSDRVVESDNLTLNQRKVLEVFQLEVYTEGATAQEIGEALPDVARGSLIRILSTLLKKGLIQQRAKRQPYTLTEEGLTRLTRKTRLTQSVQPEKNGKDVSQPSQPSLQLQTDGKRPSQRKSQPSHGSYYDSGL